MQFLRLQLRRFTWIAMCAVLGLALVPTLSHALAFAQGGQGALAEICTPQGRQLVALEDDAVDGRAPATGAHQLEHCPYCATSASALGLPVATLAALAVPLAGVDAPPPVLRTPRALFAWPAAQPRAPPVSH